MQAERPTHLRKNKRPVVAHFERVPPHDAQIGPHRLRKIRLVDHLQYAATFSCCAFCGEAAQGKPNVLRIKSGGKFHLQPLEVGRPLDT